MLRAPLLAEEFRAAFFTDKLIPYQELMRLCLDAGQLPEAFGYAEQARARALSERLAQPTGNAVESGTPDAFTTNAQARLGQLRTELSWYYNLLNRPAAPDAPLAEWQEAMRAREQETLEIARQLQHRLSVHSVSGVHSVRQLQHRAGQETEAPSSKIKNQKSKFQKQNPRLQATLGPNRALVEYAALDGEWLAFVVTAQEIVTVRGLGLVAETQRLVERLQFQLRAPRYGRAALAAHETQLVARAQFYLRALHEILLARIIPHAPQPHWIIIPHGVLNYVPFHALHDGRQYVVEQREIVVAPSATVWQHCRAQTARKWENALLLGVGDERAPLVREEVAALAPLFRQTLTLLDEAATLDALRANLPAADVLHWASHGHFRPDNPLFSRLRLGDGWLTVREAETLPLAGRLVTLSACETGLSRIAPGQEITGLARGFFAAGARSLVLSLWTVDDAAAVALMTVFYQSLRAGQTPAAALRVAQRELLLQYPHPFYWAPFVLLGAG